MPKGLQAAGNDGVIAMTKPVGIKKKRRSSGFTLLELMVVVAVAGVLASLALPSFRDYVGTQRIRGASFDLSAAIIFARSEAIKRNGNVDLVQTGGNWNKGWTIVSAGNTLGTQNAFSGLVVTDSANLATLSFGNDGRLATATKFTIDLTTSSPRVPARCIKINVTGVPNSTQGSCT